MQLQTDLNGLLQFLFSLLAEPNFQITSSTIQILNEVFFFYL